MRLKIITLACMFFAIGVEAQVINFTPNANTIIVTTNTTVGIGGGNFKTYLVCPGITLSYAESSSMDTILLESGATLKFDSAFSYGYATLYAKPGSTVDMNFRQTGKIFFVNGVTVLDSNVGPPSFFMGSSLVTTINYIYTNLPGGTACAPSGLLEEQQARGVVTVYNNENDLIVHNSGAVAELQIKIFNMTGQLMIGKKMHDLKSAFDISLLPHGIYRLVWSDQKQVGSLSFSK